MIMNYKRLCLAALVGIVIDENVSRTVGFVIQPHTATIRQQKQAEWSGYTNVNSRLSALPEETPQVAKDGLNNAINFFDSINQDLIHKFESTLLLALKDVQSATMQVSNVLETASNEVSLVLQNLIHQLDSMVQTLISQNPALEPFYKTLVSLLGTIVQQQDNLPSSTMAVLFTSSLVSYIVLSSLFSIGKGPPPSKPYPLEKYDAVAARAYFDNQIVTVIKRSLDIFTTSLGFGIDLLQDYIKNEIDKNSNERAVQLAQLLTKLGPTFIKVGQSLSIRTDLLSPAYVRGLQTLQDQVPPFDSKIARDILKDEWGAPVESVVDSISETPVAAASLGQVYKARLKETGQEVAIKVQRPDIMNQIALDMHLLREFSAVAKQLFTLNTDTVGTTDAWGTGFVDELDYLSEARNAQVFMEGIQATPLKDVVFAPPVIEKYSTGRVLVTEWVDGERLDRSSQDDVTVLCSIAMNTYLTMMLETGLLHCDPHPGNLLRTPDGRLCILDWGMVTRLDSELQITLIEHMAHLTSADYKEIPKDLLVLGFIPPAKAHLISDSGVVEVLADIYGAWTKGGGAAAINVNQVVSQLQDLTAAKGNLFQIPPYFAYIAKSFSVLEGIGLSNDDKYSIINECLPYVSKRLLTDQSDRAGGALSTFIFGPNKTNVETRLVDYKRVEQLVTGFGNYTTSASGALLGKEGQTRTQLLEGLADQVLDLIFVEEETPLQSILLEQFAKIITAESRSLWDRLKSASGTLPTGRSVLGTLVDPLGVWRTSPLVRMNDLDHQTVQTTRKLVSLVQTQLQQTTSGDVNDMFDLSKLSQDEIVELTTILGRKFWERRSGVLKTSNRFAAQIFQLTAARLARGERIPLVVDHNNNNANENTNINGDRDIPSVTTRPARTRIPIQPPHNNGVTSSRLNKAKKMLTELEEVEKQREPTSNAEKTNTIS